MNDTELRERAERMRQHILRKVVGRLCEPVTGRIQGWGCGLCGGSGKGPISGEYDPEAITHDGDCMVAPLADTPRVVQQQDQMTYLGQTELTNIRARDAESGATWFDGPASFTARAARDRRALLGEVDRLVLLVRQRAGEQIIAAQADDARVVDVQADAARLAAIEKWGGAYIIDWGAGGARENPWTVDRCCDLEDDERAGTEISWEGATMREALDTAIAAGVTPKAPGVACIGQCEPNGCADCPLVEQPKEHKQGCPALGGYGTSDRACICGVSGGARHEEKP